MRIYNCQRLPRKRDSLWRPEGTRPERHPEGTRRQSGHDRLIDRRPAGSGYTAFGTVLRRDITRSIEVTVQREATHLRRIFVRLRNIFQVFQHDRRAGLDRLNNLLAQDVIGVTTKTRLPVAHLLQVSFGRLRDHASARRA